MLDSGEADSFTYSHGRWDRNLGELAPQGAALVRRGFLRRYQDTNTGSEFTGFYVNTNKTADRFKDLNDKGYEIPWQHDEVIRLIDELVAWQKTFNPIHHPTKWTDLTNANVTRSHTKAQMIARGASCFLFRDPIRSSKDHPIYTGRLLTFWHALLDELEKRVEARGETLPNGKPIRFIEKRDVRGNPRVPIFDLHSLRVSILTAFSVEGGVPLSILSKCVAGHASVLMTLYYLKQGPSYISQQLAEAQAELLGHEQENYSRFRQDCDLANAESVVAFNDKVGLLAAQERSAAGWLIGDLGICPVGGSLCDVGGPKLTGENGRKDFQPTPGGPRNCVRCRFFLSGPAFLGGLVAHFNSVGIEVVEASEQLRRMQTDITTAENEILNDGAEEAASSTYRRLDALYSRRETAMTELDVLAHNWHATYTLIERSKAILATAPESGEPGKSVRLLATVDLTDVATALGEARPFDLYNSVCQHATVYPAPTVPRATLRRGRLLDAMLARNHREPIFASLTDDEALAVGNELVNFLYARLGYKETACLIEGSRLLEASGIADDMDVMLTERIGAPVKLSTLIYQEPAPQRAAQLALEGDPA
ncbi:VPA1269 family protein [Paraburkholderia adhaesiva]|uniref:VPA1269 family protein n=1 Tax=Paraburkholderia adhaesiva TaxID=2883244 RepID=UPI003570A74D